MTAPPFNPSSMEMSANAAARELGISRPKLVSLLFRGIVRGRSVGRMYLIDRSEIERLRIEHPELLG